MRAGSREASAAHSRFLFFPSLPTTTSFYYLKSYVEGTGVVHLAAGIG